MPWLSARQITLTASVKRCEGNAEGTGQTVPVNATQADQETKEEPVLLRSFLMSTLHGGEWPVSHPRPLCLRWKLTQYPLYRIPTFLYKVATVSSFMNILRSCNMSGFYYGVAEALRCSEMLRGAGSFRVIVVSGQRSDLQRQNSLRRMPETGGCIIISLNVIPDMNTRADTIIVQKAVLQQWPRAVNQHCGLCSAATTSRIPLVWTLSDFPSGYHLDARGIKVRSQPTARDF